MPKIGFQEIAGTIIMFGGQHGAGNLPPGWLLCDGSAISRTVYAALFVRIGLNHGQGDGSTTFNLPDYRGRFLRGVDFGTGRDPENGSRSPMNTGGTTSINLPGSIQGHMYSSHAHNFGVTIYGNVNSVIAQPAGSSAGPSGTWSSTTAASGGTENRPINAYVNYLIKY